MTRILFSKLAAATVIILVLTGLNAAAQLPATSANGVSAAMVKLFGNHNAFTAQVEVQALDAQRKETLRMPMNFACLDGKIRVEIDLSLVKSKEITPKQIEQLKQAGASKIVSVIRPDKKQSYVMYPGTQNYAIIPMPDEEADAANKTLKIEKTPLGKETIEGHPCVKNRLTVKNGKTIVMEATTWNATDLKDFPIQIESSDKTSTSIMRFRKIQFGRPDPKKFEPPAQYRLAK